MTSGGQEDVWAEGEQYERYVGRWSRLVARDFLDWLGLPPGLRWLDVGCGTGELSRAILEHAKADRVVGLDLPRRPSAGAGQRRILAWTEDSFWEAARRFFRIRERKGPLL